MYWTWGDVVTFNTHKKNNNEKNKKKISIEFFFLLSQWGLFQNENGKLISNRASLVLFSLWIDFLNTELWIGTVLIGLLFIFKLSCQIHLLVWICFYVYFSIIWIFIYIYCSIILFMFIYLFFFLSSFHCGKYYKICD